MSVSSFTFLNYVDNTVKTEEEIQQALAVWCKHWARMANAYLFTGELAAISCFKSKIADQARAGQTPSVQNIKKLLRKSKS